MEDEKEDEDSEEGGKGAIPPSSLLFGMPSQMWFRIRRGDFTLAASQKLQKLQYSRDENWHAVQLDYERVKCGVEA